METEDWEIYREEQKTRRQIRLPVRQEEIESLKELGYVVEKKSDYHYRINNQIDVCPIHNRYHILKTNKRGGYKQVVEFIKKQIKLC